ncbi:hypothetical protein IJJ53_03525 [Candidatus Saccharibacteria bacterium]|nr:hypothetical protein [Candidatus Saccharibacteria bacterium]
MSKQMMFMKAAKRLADCVKRNKQRCLSYACIALVALFGLSVFFSSGYPSGDDVGYHAASVMGMVDNNVFDILTGKINGYIANDLGYGGGIFYPPLTHIATTLIYKIVRMFGLDVFFAFKIFYFFVLFFAGIFMYELIRLITRHEKAALFSGLFYITFPYVLSDILIRSAMAESAIFVFMPVVLMGVYYLLHDDYKKFLLCFVIGGVGMVHSHLVLTMFFTVVCVIGFLPRIKVFLKKRRILYFCIGCIVIMLLSLPFLLPMLQNKLNVDYRVFEPGFMSSLKTVQEWRLSLDTLFSFDRPMKTVAGFMNIFGLCIIIYAIVRYRKIKTRDNVIFLWFAIVVSILCMLCTTTLFSWSKLPSVFLMIQFPWRLCSFVAFSSAILLGFSLQYLDREVGESRDMLYILVGVACCFSVFRINNLVHPAQDLDQGQLAYYPALDYLPTVTPSSLEYINTHTRMPIPNDGDVQISNVYSKTPDMSFDVVGVSNETKIVLPRLYYLGYIVEARYKDGTVEKLSYSMSEDGFIELSLNCDAYVLVSYSGTEVQKVSYMIAGATLIGLVFAWKVLGRREANDG